MAVTPGFKQYLVMYPEVTWGTKPGSPTYTHVPVTSCNVRLRAQNRKAKPYTGILASKYSFNFRGHPVGNIVLPLFGYVKNGKSLAELVTDWAFDDANGDSAFLPSMGLQWAQPDNSATREINGARVDSVTISGSEDGDINCTLAIQGKTDVDLDTLQTIPTDMEQLSAMEFVDTVLTINSVEVPLSAFTITQVNGLRPRFLNSTSPTHLSRGQRDITLAVTLMKDVATYDVLDRVLANQPYRFDIQLAIKGLHNGTGTGGTNYTVCTFDFPSASIEPLADDIGGMEDLIMQPLTFTAMKPDTSEGPVIITYTEV